jgi:glucose-1-phosphate adenylyltransferase
MDLQGFLASHTDSGADLTVATIPVTADEAPAFGILKTDEAGVITEFHEKPPRDQLDGLDSPVSDEMRAQGRIYLASMGIYVFEREAMAEALSVESHIDFGKEIIPEAIGKKRVVSFPHDGYWSDIGTVSSFFDANLSLAYPQPEFDLFDEDAPLYTRPRMLPPAKLQDAFVRDSIVGEASVITRATVENCVIGIRSYIGEGAVLRRVVMLGADYHPWRDPERRSGKHVPSHPGIGENSVIENAIIDRNAQIGANCRIMNNQGVQDDDGDGWHIRDGIIVIKKNAVIPDGTVI